MNSVGGSGSNPMGMVFREWRLAIILSALLLVGLLFRLSLDRRAEEVLIVAKFQLQAYWLTCLFSAFSMASRDA